MNYYEGLVFGCPLGEEVSDCPLKEIRQIEDVEARLDTFWSLTNEERMRIEAHHRQCITRREREEGIS